MGLVRNLMLALDMSPLNDGALPVIFRVRRHAGPSWRSLTDGVDKLRQRVGGLQREFRALFLMQDNLTKPDQHGVRAVQTPPPLHSADLGFKRGAAFF